MKKMRVNEAYDLYTLNPNVETYDQLGESLVQYIKAIIASKFGSRFNFLKEAVGESACNIFANLSTYDKTKNVFHMWVYTIVYNTCIDQLRMASTQKEWELILSDGFVDNTSHDRKLLLYSLIPRLKKEDQELIKLKLAGFSNEDIGDGLNLSEGAVKMKWIRIMDRLRTLAGG